VYVDGVQKTSSYQSVTDCSAHHVGLCIYKNENKNLIIILACVACQSDTSSHINHFSDCQHSFVETITSRMTTTIQVILHCFSFASSTWQPTGDQEISTSLTSLRCSTGVQFLQTCSSAVAYTLLIQPTLDPSTDFLNWSNVPAQGKYGI